MPDLPPVRICFQAVPIDAIATDAVENIDVTCTPRKAAVLVFDPLDPPDMAALYSNAAAVNLIPFVRALLARLESGALRMPVTADGVRWVEGEG
jgi:hypothetical protein